MVTVTVGPANPLILVTEVGVANSTQLDKTEGPAALNTKFLFASVLIAMLPTIAPDNANIAASLATTLALANEITGICAAGTFELISKLATPLATPL